MVDPISRGNFQEQAQECLQVVRETLTTFEPDMFVTLQTVFLRDASDQALCDRLLAAHYGLHRPMTTYVHQKPCSGAALAIETWAIGGKSVRLNRHGPHAISVSYNNLRWVYCGGIAPAAGRGGVYQQTAEGLKQMNGVLEACGVKFFQVARTWFYLGSIVAAEGQTQRYKELNRGRADFFKDIEFCREHLRPGHTQTVYPASTGIGMDGNGLAMACLALDTRRKDVILQPLENPQQTPAYGYASCYSPQSPKFSRAMAALAGEDVTTWVSGTASIVNSETMYPGDAARQTEQTIENIERLIAPENFTRHALEGAGATLTDLAKVRVYVKRAEDYRKCRAVCERRLGSVPVIYTVADVCRDDLLVEIEGVAFSKRAIA